MSSMERPALMTGGSSQQPIRQVFEDPQHPVGTRAVFEDGRVFYYACNRQAALSRYKLAQALSGAVTISTRINSDAAAGIGDTQLTVTMTSPSTIAANYFEGGFMAVMDTNTAGNEAYFYRISGNDATATDSLTIQLDDPLEAVLTTNAADDLDISPNPYQGVAVAEASFDRRIVGVPNVDVPAGSTTPQYFWMQSWGPCCVLTDGAVGLGSALTQSASVVGALKLVSSAVQPHLAVTRLTTVDADYNPVYLTINP